MSITGCIRRVAAVSRAESGFTMLITIMVMLVTSLLLVAAFTAANGDIDVSRADFSQKQAYFAALAGIQEYQYELEANPNYWQSCGAPKGTVPGETGESYEVTTLAASSDTESSKTCNSANPFTSIIESKGALANTFRIKSVGKAGASKRSIVANFQVAGFLNYVYFTQYEVRDPASHGGSAQEQEECENYRARREEIGALGTCGTIVFASEDNENGPLHTDDAAVVCGGAEFGRAGHEPPDVAEINGGVVAASPSSGCSSGSGKFNTPTGGSIVGPELVAPESDGSLKSYVEPENEFAGRTTLVLEGTLGKIKVTTVANGVETTKSINWPKNKLIYVRSAEAGCAYTKFSQEATDTSTTYAKEEGCGSVYVKGNYKESLTIAAETDLIINGSITPSGVTPPAAPSGTATLGLIANRFIRVYHPCPGTGLSNPWIYAAILSTSHSFLVDNYNCGSTLGNLNVYGAIGQKFRGIVGETGTHGYTKEYIYDERLASDEPPYFLAPLKAGWKIARETSAEKG